MTEGVKVLGAGEKVVLNGTAVCDAGGTQNTGFKW